MSNVKVKGLLKGLRYISQIFENEKEPEMQIGYPTDVKHVAHIGWDGPSVNDSPSWMNEFKSPRGFSSAPLSPNGDMKQDDSLVKWVSEDSTRKGSRAMRDSSRRMTTDLPEQDFAQNKRRARHCSSTGESIESTRKEKSDKPRQARRSSKNSSVKDSIDGSKSSKGSDSPLLLPDIPKKTRKKKPKDSSVEGSSSRSSRSKAQAKEADESISASKPPPLQTVARVGVL